VPQQTDHSSCCVAVMCLPPPPPPSPLRGGALHITLHADSSKATYSVVYIYVKENFQAQAKSFLYAGECGSAVSQGRPEHSPRQQQHRKRPIFTFSLTYLQGRVAVLSGGGGGWGGGAGGLA